MKIVNKISAVVLSLLILVMAIFVFVFVYQQKTVLSDSTKPNLGKTLLDLKTNDIYEALVTLKYGSDSAGKWGDWGKILNRIYSAALWSPDATSNPADVLEGETFYSGGSRYEKTGSIPIRDGDNSTTSQSSGGGINYLTAPNGYYDGSDSVSATDSQIAALDPDLISTNLLTGVNIFGVAGNLPVMRGDNSSTLQVTASGNIYLTTQAGYYIATSRVSATNAQIAALSPHLVPTNILSGTNIFGVNGNIPINNGDNTSTAQATGGGIAYLTAPAGYYDGTDRVSATDSQVAALAPDLAASNLLSTATIFGISGNIPIKSGDSASTTQATAGGIAFLTAPTGYYDGNDRVSATNAQIAALSASLTPGNLLNTATIFGVTGNITIRDGDNASTSQATAGGIVYLTSPAGYYDGDDRVSATNAQIVALDPNLASGNILTGLTVFGVTGTYPNPTNCSTQQYHDSYGAPVTEITNCSLTWTTASVPVVGDDNRAGRGGKDPRTGLVWSKYLKNNAGTVEFADSGGSTWSWDATGANNIAVGTKTAIQLCSERGNGWRLPTLNELQLARIDGSYWNLTNPSNLFWSATEHSAANSWLVALSTGNTVTNTKGTLYSVRCVR
jgi:hypothetical protein